jgi:hypothetical protein
VIDHPLWKVVAAIIHQAISSNNKPYRAEVNRIIRGDSIGVPPALAQLAACGNRAVLELR